MNIRNLLVTLKKLIGCHFWGFDPLLLLFVLGHVSMDPFRETREKDGSFTWTMKSWLFFKEKRDEKKNVDDVIPSFADHLSSPMFLPSNLLGIFSLLSNAGFDPSRTTNPQS